MQGSTITWLNVLLACAIFSWANLLNKGQGMKGTLLTYFILYLVSTRHYLGCVVEDVNIEIVLN